MLYVFVSHKDMKCLYVQQSLHCTKVVIYNWLIGNIAFIFNPLVCYVILCTLNTCDINFKVISVL